MPSYRETDNVRQRFQPHTESRSATPPPISSARRIIIDESAEENEYHNGNSPSYTAITKGNDVEDPLSRTHSLNANTTHSHYPPLSYRASSRPTSQRELRSPALGHSRLHRDSEYDLNPRNGERYPTRRMDYRSIDEEMDQDYTNESQNEDAGPSFLAHPPPGVDHRSRFSDDTISISKQSMVSTNSSRMPDFFGSGIFQVVLHNPTTSHQLLKYSESRFCSENVEFLGQVLIPELVRCPKILLTVRTRLRLIKI